MKGPIIYFFNGGSHKRYTQKIFLNRCLKNETLFPIIIWVNLVLSEQFLHWNVPLRYKATKWKTLYMSWKKTAFNKVNIFWNESFWRLLCTDFYIFQTICFQSKFIIIYNKYCLPNIPTNIWNWIVYNIFYCICFSFLLKSKQN